MTWNVAVPPDEDMLREDCELVSVKSGVLPEEPPELPPPEPPLPEPPIPVNVTDCGEFCAAPEIVKLPVVLPEAVGANVT